MDEMLCLANIAVRSRSGDTQCIVCMLKKLDAADMWFIRKILRITYTDHVTNKGANIHRKLLCEIVNRQVNLFGHSMRQD